MVSNCNNSIWTPELGGGNRKRSRPKGVRVHEQRVNHRLVRTHFFLIEVSTHFLDANENRSYSPLMYALTYVQVRKYLHLPENTSYSYLHIT